MHVWCQYSARMFSRVGSGLSDRRPGVPGAGRRALAPCGRPPALRVCETQARASALQVLLIQSSAAEELDMENEFLLPPVFGEEYEEQPRPRSKKKVSS